MDKIKKELGRFLLAGSVVLAVDATIYYILLFFLTPSPSKAAAFACGTTTAYLINKFWTFKKKEYFHQEVIKFIILYLSTMGINVGLNKMVLLISFNFVLAAYITATAVSATFNFIGQKFFVFRNN